MLGGGDASGNPDESFESPKSGVHNCKEQRPSRSDCRHLSGPLSFFPMFSHPSKIDATVLADMTPTLSVKVPVVRVSGCHAGEHRAVVTAPASWRGPSVEALRASRSSRRARGTAAIPSGSYSFPLLGGLAAGLWGLWCSPPLARGARQLRAQTSSGQSCQ